jgi:hypothetical protein
MKEDQPMLSTTLAARSAGSLVFATFVAGALLVGASAAHAATPEWACQMGRYKAAARYSACQDKVVGKLFGGAFLGGSPDRFDAVLSKCRVRYTTAWVKLVAKGTGSSTCVDPRFVDNGDGTVTDRLTALQWEKKDNLDSTPNLTDRHDADNTYTWSAGIGLTAAGGTAYTDFLATLNGGGCFAGQCDWRLPTMYELQTILLGEPYPCTTSPCIDQAAFGPTVGNVPYWSATTYAWTPDDAWFVTFGSGGVHDYAFKGNHNYVRAVRAGL